MNRPEVCAVCGHEWWKHQGKGGRCWHVIAVEGDVAHECDCERFEPAGEEARPGPRGNVEGRHG